MISLHLSTTLLIVNMRIILMLFLSHLSIIVMITGKRAFCIIIINTIALLYFSGCSLITKFNLFLNEG